MQPADQHMRLGGLLQRLHLIPGADPVLLREVVVVDEVAHLGDRQRYSGLDKILVQPLDGVGQAVIGRRTLVVSVAVLALAGPGRFHDYLLTVGGRPAYTLDALDASQRGSQLWGRWSPASDDLCQSLKSTV